MQSGQRVGYRYELQEKLGAGGMGAVYVARDLLTGQDIALKQLDMPTKNLHFNSRTTETNLRLALAREFRTLASLRHPNIISVLDYGFDGGNQPYFTMQLLQNMQLFGAAARQHDTVGKVQLLIQLLQALVYLHRRGIVHRDLKPANVAVEADGTVRVLDFGLAVEPGKSSEVAGTLAYIAPEVLRQQPLSPAADLYAVGVMAYEIFTGHYPFSSDDDENASAMIMRIIADKPRIDLLDVEFGLEMIIERLLQKDPKDRYASAKDVIKVLSEAIDQPIPSETHAIRESFIQAAKFVGREDILQQFHTALNNITRPDAQGSAWIVGGESGVGKTRLLDEIRTRALVQGAIVLHGQAVEGGGLPYQVWRGMTRHLLLTTQVEPLEASILKEIVPDIADFVGFAVDDAPTLTGDAAQKRLASTILALLRRQDRPIVLLLEDLQWTVESLLPLQLLSSFIKSLPILAIGNYRDDERPNLPQELPDCRPIKLDRLPRYEIEQLTVSILGEIGHQEDVVDLLESETEGNVFFIVEVVRALAEEAGSLAHIGQFTLPEAIFTSGIQRIMERRLKQIPEHYHYLLNAAAIAGRVIDPAILHQIDPSIPLDEWLYACTDAAVLEVRDDTYRFAHDKLREEVLALLLDVEKPILHQQVAEAIEVVHAANIETYAAALARHWQIVGDATKEGYYATIAADNANKQSLFREALNFYQRAFAVEAYTQAEHPDREKIRLLNKIGEANQSLGDYDLGRTYQLRGLEIAEAIGHDASIVRVLNDLCDIDVRLGYFDRARDYAERSLKLVRQLDEPLLLGFSLMNVGNLEDQTLNFQDAYKMRKECYEVMKEAGEMVDITKALNNLAISTEHQLGLEEALPLYEESLRLRREINDRSGIATTLNNIGGVLTDLDRDLDKALAYAEEALQIAHELDWKMAIAVMHGTVGSLHRKFGDDDLYLQHQLASVQVATRIGNRGLAAMRIANIGMFEHERGNYAVALDYLRDATKIRLEVQSREQQLIAIGHVAYTLLELGRTGEAVALMTLVLREGIPGDRPHQEHGLKDMADVLKQARQTMDANLADAAIKRGEALSINEACQWIVTEM